MGNNVIALGVIFKYIKHVIFIMFIKLYLPGKRQRKIITFLKICQTS